MLPALVRRQTWNKIPVEQQNLGVKDLIIIPALDKLHNPVIKQFFNETFPDFKIRMVKENKILEEEGRLNCFVLNLSLKNS